MIPQVYYVAAMAVVMLTASWKLSGSLAALTVKMEALQLEVQKSTGNAIQFAKDLGSLEARVTLLERNKQ